MLTFCWENHKVEIEKGLDFIVSKGLKHQVLDEFAIETMIYHIEEMLESEPQLRQIEGIAFTADSAMQQLNQLFFKAEKSVDRVQLEHGFNDFVEHIQYYIRQVGEGGLDVLVYFIFIREMMHHLKIRKIYWSI